jgi:hypothetical protein
MINFVIKEIELIWGSYHVVFMAEVFNISLWHLSQFNKNSFAVSWNSSPKMCPHMEKPFLYWKKFWEHSTHIQAWVWILNTTVTKVLRNSFYNRYFNLRVFTDLQWKSESNF